MSLHRRQRARWSASPPPSPRPPPLLPSRLPAVLLASLIGVAQCSAWSGSCWDDRPKDTIRVVSMGDLHGEWTCTIGALQNMRLIDSELNWIGGNSILVQTGDVIDRGNYGKPLIELLFKLRDQAKEAGGRVELVLGNHEILAMSRSNYGWATKEDMAQYDKSGKLRDSMDLRFNYWNAWSATGSPGREVRDWGKAVVVIGSIAFSHAGIEPWMHKAWGASLNKRLRKLLDVKQSGVEGIEDEFFKEHGPFSTRKYHPKNLNSSPDALAGACDDLDVVLERLGAKRLVIGHNRQVDGKVKVKCAGKLILADTMMSQGFTNNLETSVRNTAALEFFVYAPSGIMTPMTRREAFIVHPLLSESRRCNRLPNIGDVTDEEAAAMAILKKKKAVRSRASYTGGTFSGSLMEEGAKRSRRPAALAPSATDAASTVAEGPAASARRPRRPAGAGGGASPALEPFDPGAGAEVGAVDVDVS